MESMNKKEAKALDKPHLSIKKNYFEYLRLINKIVFIIHLNRNGISHIQRSMYR